MGRILTRSTRIVQSQVPAGPNKALNLLSATTFAAHNFNVTNTVVSPLPQGSAVVGNGSNAYAKRPIRVGRNPPLFIVVHGRRTATATSGNTIYALGYPASLGSFLGFRVHTSSQGTSLFYRTTDGGTYYEVGTSSNVTPLNTDFCAVGVIAGLSPGDAYLYINGNKYDSIITSATLIASSLPYSIETACALTRTATELFTPYSIYSCGYGTSISEQTARDISLNPNLIFAPVNRPLYFDVGAGGTAGAVLEGAAAGAASASGALTTGIPIAGAALSVASASGTLAVGIPLSGAAAAMSTASGSLTAQLTLAGSALAQAVSSALLSSGITMTAAAVAQAAADGTLTTAIQMLGGAQAQAGGSGSLTTSTGGLEGNAQASASASASLSTQIRLSGAAIASAGASGSLGGSANLAGTAVSTASASGELTVNIALTAQALASAIAQGSLTARIDLAGHAVATIWAGGDLTAAGSMVIPAARRHPVGAASRRSPAIQITRR